MRVHCWPPWVWVLRISLLAVHRPCHLGARSQRKYNKSNLPLLTLIWKTRSVGERGGNAGKNQECRLHWEDWERAHRHTSILYVQGGGGFSQKAGEGYSSRNPPAGDLGLVLWRMQMYKRESPASPFFFPVLREKRHVAHMRWVI